MPHSPPIAILAPTLSELRATVRRLRLTGGRPLYRGRHGGVPLLAGITGIGGDRVRQALEQLHRHHRLAGLIVIGFAGGLAPELQAGQVVRVTAVCDEGGRMWRLDGEQAAGEGAGRSAPAAAGAAWGTGGVVGLTVDRVASTPAGKRGLRQRFPGAAVVDMESAGFAAFAAARGLPLTILRAVSDPADAVLPAGLLACVNADGATHAGAALRLLLRQPQLFPAMLRLGLAAHACTVNLADAVVQWLSTQAASGLQ